MSEADIERYIWTPHHTWAGEELYGICVGLRGFYMKVAYSWHAPLSMSEQSPDLSKGSLDALLISLRVIKRHMDPERAGHAGWAVHWDKSRLHSHAHLREAHTPAGQGALT